MEAKEISESLNRIYPEFSRNKREKGFFRSRTFIRIDVDKQHEITDIRLEKLSFVKWFLRKVFRIGDIPSITKTSGHLKGRIDYPTLDQNGRNCLKTIIKSWYHSPLAKGKCPLESQWFWPADLNELGLQGQDQVLIDQFLDENFDEMMSQDEPPAFPKHGTPLEMNGKQWTLPRTLFMLPGHRVIFFPDQKKVGIVGKGGERTVKFAYDVTTGTFCAKKRIEWGTENEVLRFFHRNPCKGIVSCLGFREVPIEEGKTKLQVIQPKYERTLTQLIRNNDLTFEEKIEITKDLFEGLTALHKRMTHTVVEDEVIVINRRTRERTRRVDVTHLDHYVAHRDIKPSNILVQGRKNAVLSDFGYCGKNGSLAGTRGYMPPEYLQHFNKRQKKSEKAEINMNLGQNKDVWAMGLTMVCLIEGKYGLKGTAPLPCIQRYLKVTNKKLNDQDLTKITQEEIDQDIDTLIAHLPDDEEHDMKVAVWNLVRDCLQVDYNDRITSEEAFQKLEEILSS